MSEQKRPIRPGSFQTQGSRPNMEDRLKVEYLEPSHLLIAIVADGIGGGPHGELAAEKTVETIFSEIREGDKENIPHLLRTAIEKANEVVLAESRKTPHNRGMGSTVTVVAIQDKKLYLANLGDSRVYLVRKQEVVQLTRDHTWGNYLKYEERKSVHPDDPRTGELVRSIGHAQHVKVDLGIYWQGGESEAEASGNQGYVLQTNERIVLCSDGLIKSRHNDISRQYVELEELQRIVQRYEPVQAAKKLIQQANARQVDDNASVIVLETPDSTYDGPPYFPPEYVRRIGILGIVAILFTLLFVFNSGSPTAVTPIASLTSSPTVLFDTFTPIATNTSVPPAPKGFVRILRFDPSARYTIPGSNARAVTGEDIPLSLGLTLASGGGILEIRLEAITLVLERNSVVVIEQVKGFNEATETIIRMQGGVLVAEGQVSVLGSNRQVAESLSQDGILGVVDEAGGSPFTLHCLQGLCQLNGVTLDMGWANCVGATCGAPFLAEYDLFLSLSARIPTPTPLPPTPTATSTPTNTRIPTRITPVSTATASIMPIVPTTPVVPNNTPFPIPTEVVPTSTSMPLPLPTSTLTPVSPPPGRQTLTPPFASPTWTLPPP